MYKRLVAISLILGCCQSTASGWQIQPTEGGHRIVNSKPNEKPGEHHMSGEHCKPEIQETKVHGNFDVIIFYHCTAGTSTMTDLTYGVVYDKVKKAFVGRSLFTNEPLSAEAEPKQPDWDYKKDGSIVVTHPLPRGAPKEALRVDTYE